MIHPLNAAYGAYTMETICGTTHCDCLPDSNINELKKSMVKNTKIQVVDNLTDNFRGYAALLRKIKQRVLLAQQRVIYAANEEMLRMYWDVGEMLQQSQDADGWGKKTLQRLAVDLKNDYSEIRGFSVRNMQCMIQFFNEYNQELTMVKGGVFPITQPVVAQLGQHGD